MAKRGSRVQAVVVTFAVVVLCLLSSSLTQAAGCVPFGSGSDGAEYVHFRGRSYLIGTANIYQDPSCLVPHDFVTLFIGGIAYAGSESSAISICEANSGGSIAEAYQHGRHIWYCGAGSGSSTVDIRVNLGTVSGQPDAASALEACKEKFPQTTQVESIAGDGGSWSCWYIEGQFLGGIGGFLNIPDIPLDGLRLRAFDGMDSGIQFRRLTQYYVGNQSVLDMGVQDVVDIWGNIGSGYEVCFPLPGRVIFLDAATSPRAVSELETYTDDGYTCVTAYRAGMMVLVESETGSPASTERRPGTDDSVDTAIALENCVVTARHNLFVRSAPWGAIWAVIPSGTTVMAVARTESWFQVSYLGTNGWSAAWLTDSDGDCAWQ